MYFIKTLVVLLSLFCTYTAACCCGKPRDCQDIQDMSFPESSPTGIYTIYPDGTYGIQVRCDMKTDGGGWTVIQRRISDSDFYKKWDDYRFGFGSVSSNYWLGNEQIYMITKGGWYELRIDLWHPVLATHTYAKYKKFELGGWETDFKLYVAGYSGTAGDSLTYHSGAKFSTQDNDNDVHPLNCSSTYSGAWWFKSCHHSNLNGDYGNNAYGMGLNWYHWTGYTLSLERTEMKIRRIQP